jgi:hypothetical protein
MTKIRTMTIESMEWYGTVHMDSIWNDMEWDFIKKFTKSNMESINHSTWIPWTGFHME